MEEFTRAEGEGVRPFISDNGEWLPFTLKIRKEFDRVEYRLSDDSNFTIINNALYFYHHRAEIIRDNMYGIRVTIIHVLQLSP